MDWDKIPVVTCYTPYGEYSAIGIAKSDFDDNLKISFVITTKGKEPKSGITTVFKVRASVVKAFNKLQSELNR